MRRNRLKRKELRVRRFAVSETEAVNSPFVCIYIWTRLPRNLTTQQTLENASLSTRKHDSSKRSTEKKNCLRKDVDCYAYAYSRSCQWAYKTQSVWIHSFSR